MSNKKKVKKQKEIDMEAALVKSGYLEDLEDLDSQTFEQSIQDKEKNDIKSALQLLKNDNEIIIDRDQEDKDIVEFQKTGNIDILEKVYKNRIPTLKSWANKNYYPGLTTSVEDLLQDLSVVFIKAAQKYNRNRGTFNTCLFTYLINRLKNIKNSKFAKKRVSEEYMGPLSSMILSLDFAYNDNGGDGGDGTALTLKDIISGKTNIEESADFSDLLAFLSKGNLFLKEFLKKISDGNSLASLIKEYKTRNGLINLSGKKQDIKKLSCRKNKKLATKIIKSYNIVNGDFKLLEYKLCGESKNKMKYVIEMRKTKETDLIIRAIRDLRKHKDYYISKLKGI